VNFCYAVVTRNMEWLLAGLQCRSLHKDAHLLVINDAAKQSTVADMLDSVNGLHQFHAFLSLSFRFTVNRSCLVYVPIYTIHSGPGTAYM